MKLILNASSNEFSKLISRKKYWVIMITLAAITVVMMLVSIGNFTVGTLQLEFRTMPYTILGFANLFALPILIFMIMPDLFSSEFENNSIKSILMRPISRAKIFFSKIIGAAYYILLCLLFLAVICITIQAFSGRFSEAVAIFTAYFISIIPMVAFITFSAMISQFFNNSTLAMFMSLVLYVVMVVVVPVISIKAGAVLFTSHLNFYKQLGQIDFTKLVNELFQLLSYIVLFSIGGMLLFERKDI